MFCSLKFTTLPVPVAIHSQWDAAQTRCKLRMFSNQSDAQTLISQLPPEEAESFSALISALDVSREERGIDEIEGDPALTLTNFLVTYHNSGTPQYPRAPHAPDRAELMGFWEPPRNRKPGSGIVMWNNPVYGYGVYIVHSREQVEKLIHDLVWLEEGQAERLLREIRDWNAVERSVQKHQEIRYSTAELLCKASVVVSMWASRRAMA